MKRRKVIAAILACALVISIVAYTPFKRLRQNSASVAMLRLKDDLLKHVGAQGKWPHSWDDLYLCGKEERKRESSRIAIVDWSITVDELVHYIEHRDTSSRIRDRQVPFVVRYSDRVPRDRSSELNERVWNDLIAEEVYWLVIRQQHARDERPD